MLSSRSGSLPKPLDAVIEDARLAVLRSYSQLSSDDTDALSRLAREAALSLGATHATVSFVDDVTVWFGGAFGDMHDTTAREFSFCDAVVRTMSPLLVQDGRTDPRFSPHALVRGEPGLRCYAGVPLVDQGGYALGAVAAYSTTPARFAPEILHDLAALADLVRDFLAESRLTPPSMALPVQEPPPMPRVQGWLGVKTMESRNGHSGKVAGLTVVSVAKASPALNAGLRPTDILQSIGGQDLFVSADVAAAMAGRVAGSTVAIKFRRAGRWHQCDVEVKSRRTRLSGR